jgi:hypothetical protein
LRERATAGGSHCTIDRAAAWLAPRGLRFTPAAAIRPQLARGTSDAKAAIDQQGEVPMSPFIAAFVACCGFASFIVVFGVLLPGRHPNELQHL